MSYVKAFNVLLTKFLSELVTTFPEEKKFRDMQRGLTVIIRMNFKKPTKMFKKYSDEIREKIQNKDDSYFLQRDYTDVVKPSENNFSVIDKLKDYWKDLSVVNRDIIWDYLNKMLMVVDKVAS